MFHNYPSKRNKPKLPWSFCSKFFGAKYGFFDEIIFPTDAPILNMAKEIEMFGY